MHLDICVRVCVCVSVCSINRMNIQRISPDERKTMQQRYVQVCLALHHTIYVYVRNTANRETWLY